MDQETRLMAIKKHIAILSQTQDDAYLLIQSLMQEDWDHLIASTHSPSNNLEQPCVICRKVFRCSNGPTAGICRECYPSNHHRIAELSIQRTRAIKHGLPATLTLRQWHETLNDFHGLCAYCQKYDARLKSGVLIEHFIPIKLGGGTTRENCIPGCYTCNSKKRNVHPQDVVHLFPDGTVQRIQKYLSAISDK